MPATSLSPCDCSLRLIARLFDDDQSVGGLDVWVFKQFYRESGDLHALHTRARSREPECAMGYLVQGVGRLSEYLPQWEHEHGLLRWWPRDLSSWHDMVLSWTGRDA